MNERSIQRRSLAVNRKRARQFGALFESLENRQLFVGLPNGPISATDFASLSAAITAANSAAGDDVITIDANIRLTGVLPKIASNIEFKGNSKSISGDANNNSANDTGDVRVFFINSGVVNIHDLTITNGRAQGGAGGTGAFGGGGGAGFGGGIFINAGTVSVSNVTFSNNVAIGGAGGAGTSLANARGGGGGGGGLGGNGGNGIVNTTTGGGGGGGGGYTANASGSTGGAPEGAPGGQSSTTDFGAGGGGSGTTTGNAGRNGAYGAGAGGGSLGTFSNGAGGTGGFGGGAAGGAGPGNPGTLGGTAFGSGGGGGGAGAGFFIRTGSIALTNVTFSTNAATGGAGGPNSSFGAGFAGSAQGPAGYLDTSSASVPTVTASGITFTGNTVGGSSTNNNFRNAPSVTLSPVDKTYTEGTTVPFTATAAVNGSPAMTVVWQKSTDGGTTFSDVTTAATIASNTASSYSFTGAAADDGTKYRAVFTQGNSSFTTTAAAAQLLIAPTVTTNPVDITRSVGQTATFTAAASGGPAPTVQWQVSTDGGGSFTNVAGGTSTTLSFVATPSGLNQSLWRAVFANSSGTATTTAAKLNVLPLITTNPVSQTKNPGQSVSFTAAANGTPTPTVQWQVSGDNGSTFSDIASATSATYSFTAAAADSGKQYRAVFTNSGGSSTTTAATLTVNAPPTITTNPQSQSKLHGESVTFTASADGAPAPTVQWQVSTDGGANFSNIADATSASYTFSVTANDNGKQYRAVFTNSVSSVASAPATLSVAPIVVSNPQDHIKIAGESVSFSASADGTPTPTVQWQVSSDGGATFSDISGATATTYTFNTVVADDGKKFRAVFTNSGGSATTTAASLAVYTAPSITQNPQSQFRGPGQTVTFTAAASGNPTPTVQWQVSTNAGASFSDISGATATTYSFVAASTDNLRQYRAVFANAAGSATTSAATLTVQKAIVSGTATVRWGASGSSVVTTQADGLRLLPAGRTKTMPWINVDRLAITLDVPAPLLAADVRVTGIRFSNYSVASVTGSGTTYTIALTSPVTLSDRVTISIGSDVITAWSRRLDILPGDFNGDGTVNSTDATGVRAQLPGMGTPPTIFGDVNGDGVVDNTDYNEVRARAGSLPTLVAPSGAP